MDELNHRIFTAMGKPHRSHYTRGTISNKSIFFTVPGRRGCHQIQMLRTLHPDTLVEVWDNTGVLARLKVREAMLKFT